MGVVFVIIVFSTDNRPKFNISHHTDFHSLQDYYYYSKQLYRNQ